MVVGCSLFWKTLFSPFAVVVAVAFGLLLVTVVVGAGCLLVVGSCYCWLVGWYC